MVKAARASEISPPGAVKAYPAPKAFKAKLKSSLAALECICIDEVPGGCGFMGTEVNLCGRTRAFSCTDVTCMWSTSDWDIPSSTSCECSAPQNKTKHKKPLHDCHCTIWFREEDVVLNTGEVVYLYPQYTKTSELLLMFTIDRRTSTFCPTPKWQGYKVFVWRKVTIIALSESLISHVF